MSLAAGVRLGVYEVVALAAARPLFVFHPASMRSPFAPAPDGQRFLINPMGEQAPVAPAPLTVVVNWTAAFGRDK